MPPTLSDLQRSPEVFGFFPMGRQPTWDKFEQNLVLLINFSDTTNCKWDYPDTSLRKYDTDIGGGP